MTWRILKKNGILFISISFKKQGTKWPTTERCLMLIVESAGITDTGKKRRVNEDCFIIDVALGLYIVADGMGGHAAGEVASRLAADSLFNYIKNMSERKNPEDLPGTGRNLSKKAGHLLAGIHIANQSVYDVARGNKQYNGMGTTVSAVLLTDRTFITANVGDSPVFLIRNNSIKLISALHTVASAALAANPDGEALNNGFKHMLTQAIGTKNHVEPNIIERECLTGDVIVIGSDGLTDMISQGEIRDTVNSEKPSGACKKLVDMANKNGGLDNITVIVIKIKNVYEHGNVFSRINNFFLKKAWRKPARS